MKRMFYALLSLSLALSLVACGANRPPHGMAQETYDIGLKALEIFEMYNDRKMSADEAIERLDELSEEIDSLEFEDTLEDIKNGGINVTIMSAETRMRVNETVIDEIKTLKEDLNVK